MPVSSFSRCNLLFSFLISHFSSPAATHIPPYTLLYLCLFYCSYFCFDNVSPTYLLHPLLIPHHLLSSSFSLSSTLLSQHHFLLYSRFVSCCSLTYGVP
ncbi:hypothetical protein BOTBODRAFT_407928 [Botryobasidium botryosum FD-172 SS1]|uniref:Uncharacterized protein n=1 Tax=Botryobasidium botryosum (strain FD-172 SS1) TaxID=930990 RepID=A0A067MM81_BOTB1|nr:hypothetical protein BOTBODRAFT_407928 [Botryobasidium botryosum FD-172 SS1]